jgi:hypothetical protein
MCTVGAVVLKGCADCFDVCGERLVFFLPIRDRLDERHVLVLREFDLICLGDRVSFGV